MIDNRRKSPDAYMPLWIGDYLADTTHLTTEQHGAYFLLLMAYWRRKCRGLPDDDAYLAQVCKVSAHKWRALRSAIAAFFDVAGGVWRSGRADEEWAYAVDLQAKKAAAGKKGAATTNTKRWGKATYTPPHSVNNHNEKGVIGCEGKGGPLAAEASHVETAVSSQSAIDTNDALPSSERSANGQPLPLPIRTITEGGGSSDLLRSNPEIQNLADSLLVRAEPEPRPRPASKPISSKVERGTRWTLEAVPEDWIAAAEAAHPAVDVRAEAVAFVNYWISCPGAKGLKLNWRATFMGWVGREAKRLKEKFNGRAKGQFGNGRAVIDDHPLGNFAAIADRLRADRESREAFDA